ncbi:MAG TPA: glycosyltransferase family 2 protein [Pirellulales bacterium]|jgi:hypothetical protein|nr:glycosyltransferase family 2 protein [Pirellulales bacterium]
MTIVPNVACIIPVVGNTEGLETTLVSVLERRSEFCEVIVVLNVPYSDPYHLQGEIQIIQAAPGARLVSCINRGISASRAPIVHLLATGCEVDEHWTEQALKHFKDPRVAVVTPVIFDRTNHQRLLAAGVQCGLGGKRIIHRTTPSASGSPETLLGPLLQAAFYRKVALEALGGGLSTDVGDDLADVDLASFLRQAGWRMVLEIQCRIFADSIAEIAPGGFFAGLWAERFYLRHFSEAGGFKGLLAHPRIALQDLLQSRPWWKAPAFAAGRLTALCQLGHYPAYRRLQETAAASASAAQNQWQTNRIKNQAQMASSDRRNRADVAHESLPPHNPRREHSAPRRLRNR